MQYKSKHYMNVGIMRKDFFTHVRQNHVSQVKDILILNEDESVEDILAFSNPIDGDDYPNTYSSDNSSAHEITVETAWEAVDYFQEPQLEVMLRSILRATQRPDDQNPAKKISLPDAVKKDHGRGRI